MVYFVLTMFGFDSSSFFFSSRRRHTRLVSDWSSDVCSSDLGMTVVRLSGVLHLAGRFFRNNSHSADGILVFGRYLQNRKCLSTYTLRTHCVISSCLGGASADVRRSVRAVRRTSLRSLLSCRCSALWPRSDANGSSLSCGPRPAAPLGRKQPG